MMGAAALLSLKSEMKSVRGEGNNDGTKFLAGDRVKISGLKNTPQYNGTLGTIHKWDESKKRWKVNCDCDG